MPSKKKKVILLEHEGQVKNCLKRIKNIKGQKLLIASSPFAMHELDKQDFPYNILEDYYDPKELYKLEMNNLQKVENLCDMIDNGIHDVCSPIAKAGITPAMFSFLGVKVLYDTVMTRLFQLFKLIEAENPVALLAYAGEYYPLRTALGFNHRESIYARLLALPGWRLQIKRLPYVPYPEGPHVQKKTYQKFKKLMWWLQGHPKLFDLAVEYDRCGWFGLFNRLKSYPRADKSVEILLFGQGFSWDRCRGQLQSVGIDPIFSRVRDNLEYWMGGQFANGVDVDALSNVWEGLRKNDKFREFFIWNKIDFFPVLDDYLRFLVEQLTPACLNAYEKTCEILKKRKIKAFLAPVFDSCTSHSAARAARNLSIPVIVWQHGAYGPVNHPLANYTDLMSSDILFLFGEGTVDRFKEPAKRFNVLLVSVGSALLDDVPQILQPSKAKKVKKVVKLDARKKVVLYALPPFTQDSQGICTYPPRSDNLKWRAQRAVLDVLGKHHNYTVIVKLKQIKTRFPPMSSYVREKKFENCQIVKAECTFTDLLQIADLVVLMFPGMTLLESLMTTKPIFVYTGDLHLDSRAQKLLERRAYCYQETKNLTNDLDKYLSTGKIDKDVDLNDKEFVKFYGTSSAGRGSGARVAKILKKIMEAT